VTDIRALGRPVVRFPGLRADLKVIRAFLFHRMYRAPSVMAMRAEVTRVIDDLFPALHGPSRPAAAPLAARTSPRRRTTALARIVADYIAGMTDRFALQEHAV
jgi:dGTPase